MIELLFTDKARLPDSFALKKALGETYSLWINLKSNLEKKYGPLTEEWKFYNQKSGWTLKILKKKRNLFFFKPYTGYFSITFVFGDKAVSVIEKSDLPLALISQLIHTRKYMEGRGLSIEVRSKKEMEYIFKLTAVKINN